MDSLSAKKQNPGQIADIIERFLSGSELHPQEFSDFTECRLSDPKLETYRMRCEMLRTAFETGSDRQLILLSLEDRDRQVRREAAATKELEQIVTELRMLERETQ